MPSFIETSGDIIVVPPGIELSQIITGSFPVGQNDVGAIGDHEFVEARFRLEYSAGSGTYEIASFGLDRKDASTEISGALWRTVRVHSIVRTAIELSLPGWISLLPRVRFRRRDGILTDAPDYEPSDPDGLLLAALAYRVAEITGENPALAVAETLGMKQRTATNWVIRARDAGYLTGTEHAEAAHRIVGGLRDKLPLADRPRTEEEMTLFRAHEHDIIHSYRELHKRGRTAPEPGVEGTGSGDG